MNYYIANIAEKSQEKDNMYDEITHDCICGRCGHQWRSRGNSAPAVCSKCTSRIWNDTNRTFDVIIARSCGEDPDGSGRYSFCMLEFIDMPAVTSDDAFFITREDLNEYLMNRRYPIGSALVFIGDFELDSETKNLIVHQMKLIYITEPGFNFYLSSVDCAFNVKSVIERQKAQKRFEEAEVKRAEMKEEEKRRALQFARQRLEQVAEKQKVIQKVMDESIPLEESMKALAELEGRP